MVYSSSIVINIFDCLHLVEVTSYSKTFYYDNAGRLLTESINETAYGVGNTSRAINFIYDESSMIGFEYSNGTDESVYYYQRNLLGDVIAIYDTTGTKVVEYSYDAWGNHTITTSTTANRIIAKANPIRYRGYYYDENTKLYYLNARYYSPEFRRFISPDDTSYLDYESVNGLNLYCYCGNDPINFVDPSGHFAISTLLIGLAVTSFVSWGLSKVFGSQISGGISSVFNGGTAISTGLSLCALGPWGILAGSLLIISGVLSIGFGANEIVDGFTGTNYIQDWTGWSDSTYNSIYTGSTVVSALGSVAGNMYLNSIRTNTLKGLDSAVYGPKAAKHIGERSYYDSILTQQEIIKYGKIKKAKYGVPGYEFYIKGYTVMGESGKIHRGVWSLVYGDGTIWHYLLK